MSATMSRRSSSSLGTWSGTSQATTPISNVMVHMPNQAISTNSVFKMMWLTWFAGYTLISRIRSEEHTRFGAVRHETVWRLRKRFSAVRWHDAQIEARLARLERAMLREWDPGRELHSGTASMS